MNKPIIYIVEKKKSLTAQEFDFLLSFVDISKKERILNQNHKEDAESILISDILVKIAIKQVFGIPIKEQIYSKNNNGKPCFVNQEDIYFNVSHSGKYVVCAIYDSKIGVDIQEIKDFNLNVANYICNTNENVTNSSELTKLWSQKEAVLKKYGLGLAGDIKNCLKNEYTQSIKIENYWLSISI